MGKEPPPAIKEDAENGNTGHLDIWIAVTKLEEQFRWLTRLGLAIAVMIAGLYFA